PVTVVGGGPTGIETAAELAAAGRAVRMVCGGRLAPTLGGRARRTMAAQLAGLGVDVLEPRAVRAVRPAPVVLDDGAPPAGPVPGACRRTGAAASSPTRRSPAWTTTASSAPVTPSRPPVRPCRWAAGRPHRSGRWPPTRC